VALPPYPPPLRARSSGGRGSAHPRALCSPLLLTYPSLCSPPRPVRASPSVPCFSTLLPSSQASTYSALGRCAFPLSRVARSCRGPCSDRRRACTRSGRWPSTRRRSLCVRAAPGRAVTATAVPGSPSLPAPSEYPFTYASLPSPPEAPQPGREPPATRSPLCSHLRWRSRAWPCRHRLRQAESLPPLPSPTRAIPSVLLPRLRRAPQRHFRLPPLLWPPATAARQH
jgi:hypothetical protein